MTVRLDLYDGTAAAAVADQVWAVYDAVFGDFTDADAWRQRLFDRHRERPGFRLATMSEDGRLLGFAWGYTGRRGQYWSDLVVERLPREVADVWVGGHFEFVELAVDPLARRRGVGGSLHDGLLADLAHDRALLSTDATGSDAVRLYAGRGWEHLGLLDAQRQVMGLRL